MPTQDTLALQKASAETGKRTIYPVPAIRPALKKVARAGAGDGAAARIPR